MEAMLAGKHGVGRDKERIEGRRQRDGQGQARNWTFPNRAVAPPPASYISGTIIRTVQLSSPASAPRGNSPSASSPHRSLSQLVASEYSACVSCGTPSVLGPTSTPVCTRRRVANSRGVPMPCRALFIPLCTGQSSKIVRQLLRDWHTRRLSLRNP